MLERHFYSVLDPASSIKAKISNAGVLALGYTQALRPGVKASFGLALDTQKLNDPAPVGPSHKASLLHVNNFACS